MIILDIDGCVSDNRGFASFQEWREAIPIMKPNQPIIDLMTPSLANIMFVTGRGNEVRRLTIDWFHIHWPLAIERSMGFRFRPTNDLRPSDEIKSEILDDLKREGYPLPLLAIDDDARNIAMFQLRGISTMQHHMPGALGDYIIAGPGDKL